jgi:tRNA A-37 threonylcarbamoyl transferase component Bud32
MQSIERRAIDGAYTFTLMHPERYGSLEAYQSRTADFRALSRSIVPDGWTVSEDPGVWCHVKSPEDKVPDSGFKIHVSTRHENARETLRAVVPILVDEGTTFKVLVDEHILGLSNSQVWGRAGCGKFITIYPADVEQLQRLLARLHEVTRRFDGPYILSDRQYKDSKVLFYRYGAFRAAERVNVYGEPMSFLRTADGQLIPDMRLPYFALPEGISDPFPDTEEEPEEVVLKGRYKAIELLGSYSKGGVYKCLDLETGTEVVVKEGRPFVNRHRNSQYDLVDTLKNEHRILKLLESTGVAPRPLDFFQEWEHSFLIMTMAEGMTLGRYCASGQLSLIFGPPSASDVRGYCERFVSIARKLIAGVRCIHEQGVVLQDISPRNILFDPEQDTLTFIDFESAFADQGDVTSPLIHIRTPGFGVGGRFGERPTVAEDYQALSSLLGDFLYPPTTFFALAPNHRRPMLAHVAREKGVPEAFLRLIFGVGEQPERADALLLEAERSIEGITEPEPLAPLRSDDDLRRIVDAIGSYIVDQIQSGADPLDLPTDYRRFVTNRLNVASGAAGIALFLERTRGEVPGAFLDALAGEAAKINNDRYAPGLYMGSAGIAWTLLHLGRREQAEALMDTAARSPLLFENADVFYGAAGWGLANLFFFDQLGDEKYLENAVHAFAEIKPKLEREDERYFYTNGGDVYASLGHGASGIGYFLLRLSQVTGQDEHLEVAKGLIDFDLAKGEETDETIRFHRSANDPTFFPYWRVGSAGIGSVALRFHAALGDSRYLEVARKIARELTDGYSVFPSNFLGMTGFGNFFVDMYQHTGEASYLEEARRFVDRIMLFAIEKPTGIVFPGEELIRLATDYGTGSAGTGTFFHRIVAGGGIPYFDFLAPARGATAAPGATASPSATADRPRA